MIFGPGENMLLATTVTMPQLGESVTEGELAILEEER